jgi:threonine dehydratase
MSLRSLDSLEAAADLIQSVMRPTPQFRWPLLSARTGADVFQAFHNK